MGGPIPELDVLDLDRSLRFYVGAIGFGVAFKRPEERFAFVTLEGHDLMLEEAAGPGRRFRTAALEHPYGRGVNFMFEVADVEGLLRCAEAAGSMIVIPLEERWYRRDETEYGRRQFVVADPDGYLLRFTTALGQRAAQR